jgi:hypothetical protein
MKLARESRAPLLWVALLALGGLVANASCYWPVPDCDESTGRLPVFIWGPETEALSKPCSEICAAQPGVEVVHACTSVLVSDDPGSPHPDPPPRFRVDCEVDIVICRLPVIFEYHIGDIGLHGSM